MSKGLPLDAPSLPAGYSLVATHQLDELLAGQSELAASIRELDGRLKLAAPILRTVSESALARQEVAAFQRSLKAQTKLTAQGRTAMRAAKAARTAERAAARAARRRKASR
jgi:hypothetical protein